MFLQELGEKLCMPLIVKRASMPRVVAYFPIRSAIECVTGTTVQALSAKYLKCDEILPGEDDRGHSKIKGSCFICYHEDSKRKRSTRKLCNQCKKPVCAIHCKTLTICKNCQ